MKHAIHFTLKSRNEKTGPIPISTTSRESCPPSCPLFDGGCYAMAGPLAMLWRALSGTTAGRAFVHGGNKILSLTWAKFCNAVATLEPETLWRHNQAGDLPGKGDRINRKDLAQLVKANHGRRGFTYTHKPITGPHGKANASAIAAANANGFTINLSADNLLEADLFASHHIAPVVVILPDTIKGNVKLTTPAGRTVAVCPATYRDDISCATCQLCQRRDRACIVGFPAHGVSKRRVSAIATQSD